MTEKFLWSLTQIYSLITSTSLFMYALKWKIQSAFHYNPFYKKANSTFCIFEWMKYKSGSKSYISLFLMCAVVSDIEWPWPDQTFYLHWTDLKRSWTPPWLCWTQSYPWTFPPVWMWTDNHTPSERVISKHIFFVLSNNFHTNVQDSAELHQAKYTQYYKSGIQLTCWSNTNIGYPELNYHFF